MTIIDPSKTAGMFKMSCVLICRKCPNIRFHRRRKRGGAWGPAPTPINLRGGGQHTLWLPKNIPIFSCKQDVKQEKNHKCTKLKGKIIINVTLL